MLARKPPLYVNHDHPANASILECLALPLDAPSPELTAYFEACIEYVMRVHPGAKGYIGDYLVYVEPESGVIIAAICGSYGVALRYTASNARKEAIAAGALSSLNVNGQVIEPGEEWIITRGEQDLAVVRRNLPVSGQVYNRQVLQIKINAALDEAAARSHESRVNWQHPSNLAFIAHFRTVHPKAPASFAQPRGLGMWGMGVHPDIPEYFWSTLPERANLPNGLGWMVQGVMVMVHPDTGVIFAYMTGAPQLGLRLPAAERSAILALKLSGVSAIPDVGADWLLCAPFDHATRVGEWTAGAYTYAAQG